ncbi:double-strand break repair protein [Achlya hypogyna]|uniref:Double-strand break repair protein n=1 Tax=Achlya hypogyna TaxID=1202772 RepID=A0A1V9Z636_ACHHY|nr:double-strand break repair protein [Achlya hypogyna]
MADGSVVKILVSTDNHLGYCENDGVRGKDSFRAFEEMLSIGVKAKVDFVLLAGDLFHHNKPSRATLYRTMSLLRNYCLGDGCINFQILSDQSLNFPNFGLANYEDPNMNVRLPVFSIHGNHDDPTGEAGRSLAALDLLSAANLVNYFGKSDRVDDIEVFPILLEKGETKLAIYGLGNMRDERLHRMFAQGKVQFRRPEESPDAWFSIFVVHQNRDNRGRGAKNCLPESFIPDFIDLVVWGHEHECLIDLDESLRGNFHITQPGSSVATSLIEGEAKPKKVGILEVCGSQFRLVAEPLRSVRPFKIADVVLSDVDGLDPADPKIADKIHAVLSTRVQELLDEAAADVTATSADAMEVLVRLRVEHTGYPVINNQRFGAQFVGRVANPGDILLFTRSKRLGEPAAKGDAKAGLAAPIRPPPPTDAVVRVEQILAATLDQADHKLDIFPEPNLAHALDEYVFKNVPSAFNEFVDSVLEETQTALKQSKTSVTKADIQAMVEKNVDRMRASLEVPTPADASSQALQLLSRPALADSDGEAPTARRAAPSLDSDDDDHIPSPPPKKKAAARKPRGKRKATSSDDDDDGVALPPPKKARAPVARKARATPAKKATQASIANWTTPTPTPTTIALDDSDDDVVTQPTQPPTARKLPLSFASFTQDATPAPTPTPGVAKGWGRMRK